MRTIIELPDEQVEKLARICERSRVSRASLIRKAIEEYLQRHHPQENDEAFGLWKQAPRESIAWQDQLRSEWDE